MPIYDGVNGVAREVKKKYDGVDGIAREVTKVYDGVDNVARECFSSGVEWRKYNAILHYSQIGNGFMGFSGADFKGDAYGSQGSTLLNSFITWSPYQKTVTFKNVYDTYTFSESEGFKGQGDCKTYVCDTESEIQAVANKIFVVSPVYIFKIDLISYSYYGATLELDVYKRECNVTYEYAEDSAYEVVTAEEGNLPEEGELVKGSVDEGYCVLQIDSTYYYYILEG